MKKIINLFFTTMIFAFSLSSVSLANPCEDDAKKFCADIQPGGGRIMNCLRDHSQEISQECQQSLDKMKSRGQGDAMESCKDDAKQFCADVQPGGGRIKSCLEDHFKEISQPCYEAMSSASSADTE